MKKFLNIAFLHAVLLAACQPKSEPKEPEDKPQDQL
jgi:hypothetical protein